MFHNKRSSSNPPLNRNANPSAAAAAAAQAYLQKQPSTGSLSAAAAAAALRSHASSPVPVGEIQTKRMVRRGSVSSVGSGTGSLRAPFSSGMQRRTSSGSMQERSFRSPSPGGRNLRSPSPGVLPKVPPIPTRSNRRSSSLEAPIRVNSPTPSDDSIGLTVERAVRPPSTRAAYISGLPRVREQPSREYAEAQDHPRWPKHSRAMSPPLSSSTGAGMLRHGTAARPASSLGFNESKHQSQVRKTSPPIMENERPPPPHAGMVWVSINSVAARNYLSSTRSRASSPTPSSISTSREDTAGLQPSQPLSEATLSIAKRRDEAVASSSSPRVQTPQQQKSNAASRQRPAVAVPRPSEEQIRVFQTRAASLLARPLSDVSFMQNDSTRAAVPLSTRQDAGSDANTQFSSSIGSKQHGRSISQPVSTLSAVRAGVVSPTGSTRFSATPFLDTLKHQPPTRSMSPAKSALKAHSTRASSPTGSAISEARSVLSDEGSAMAKKKKSVRVSFDERPTLVGKAAPQEKPANMVLSPQYKKGPSYAFVPDDDDGISPRPNLPLFGSVRNRKERTVDPVPQLSRPQPSKPQIASDRLESESSNDVLAEDSASKSNQPTLHAADAQIEDTPVVPKVLSLQEYIRQKEALPSLIVQPASPGTSGLSNISSDASPTTDAVRSSGGASSATELISTGVSEQRPYLEGAAADVVGEDSDGAAHVHSSAAEDESELSETAGFRSLDAIIESPGAEAPGVLIADKFVQHTPSSVVAQTVPVKFIDNSAEKEEDWEVVRAYWSGLSEQRKQQIELESIPVDAETKTDGVSETKPSIADTTRVRPQFQAANGKAVAPLPPWPDQQYQQSVKTRAPATKQIPNSSHNSAASETLPLPQSMRNGGSMRSSMRDSRPNSTDIYQAPQTDNTHKIHAQVRNSRSPENGPSAAAVALAQSVMRPELSASARKKSNNLGLTRTMSADSSTSESSFRKKRKASASNGTSGRYTMKRSMRDFDDGVATSDPRSMLTAPTMSTRFRLRSPSPSMRTPLHPSDRRSPEDSRVSRESSRFPGFGKSSKTKSRNPKAISKLSSRFVDSSDEEDSRPNFKSRFDDSDDEGDHMMTPQRVKLAPVRGIPKKVGQSTRYSTDLSDEEAPTVNNVTSGSPANSAPFAKINGRSEGEALQVGTLRDGNDEQPDVAESPSQGKKSRRGLFGLGKRKVLNGMPSDPTSPTVSHGAPSASAGALAGAFTAAVEAVPTRRSNLLRRFSSSRPGTPSRDIGKADFPFPPPPIPEEYKSHGTDRPNTSSGVSSHKSPSIRRSMRPGIESFNTPTTAPLGTVHGSRPVIMSERTGKKKRFQGLRRAFGLND